MTSFYRLIIGFAILLSHAIAGAAVNPNSKMLPIDANDPIALRAREYLPAIATIVEGYAVQPYQVWGKGIDPDLMSLSISKDRYCADPIANMAEPVRFWGAKCSSFLIAPQILLTAGHCLQNTCNGEAFVFGLNRFKYSVSKDDVYYCREILKRNDTQLYDYAIVQLDRPVTGRSPITNIRQTSNWGQWYRKIFSVGYPRGISAVVTTGFTIINSNPVNFTTHYAAQLSALGGQSGSPVFDFETGALDGILNSADQKEAWNERRGCWDINGSGVSYFIPLAQIADELRPFIGDGVSATPKSSGGPIPQTAR